MENALDFAEKTYVDVNIFEEKNKSRVSELLQLPSSCWASAEALERQRKIYEEYDIFPPMIVNGLIRYLKSFNDQNLRLSIKDNEKEMQKLVNSYLHCG